MTSPRHFESDLPALLADLYLAGTPDYRDDLVQRTARVRQRRAWTFPERWLPLELVTSRAPVTRMPWRQLGVLALIALLVAAILAVYIGTQTPKLPPPFGPAANGLIAYSKDGDIYTFDPKTGDSSVVVGGPETDLDPAFAPDGTKISFRRQRGKTGAYDLVVANADGSKLRVVTVDPLPDEATAQFTADSSAIIASGQTGIQRIDLAGATPPKDIAIGRFIPGTIRATDGAILFEKNDVGTIDLWIMDADGSNKRLLWDTHLDGDYSDLQEYRWSPDGTLIAFTCSSPDTHEGSFICLMNPDGSGFRRVTDEGNDWAEAKLRWSPDSHSIAFNRWRQVGGEWLVQPIGIASLDGGAVRSVGEQPVPEGALFDFSPDGKSLLSVPGPYYGSRSGLDPVTPVAIDVATGQERAMPFQARSNVNWQRVAP